MNEERARAVRFTECEAKNCRAQVHKMEKGKREHDTTAHARQTYTHTHELVGSEVAAQVAEVDADKH